MTVGVLVTVKVGVAVGQGGSVQLSNVPELTLALLQDHWLLGDELSSVPMVAPLPPLVTVPYTKSNLFCPSYRRTSKLTVPAILNSFALHSMLKMRLGAVPVVDV